jgi:hypothetical protein
VAESLHTRLLAELDAAERRTRLAGGPPEPFGSTNVSDLADALRAVMELHAPVPCGFRYCRSPETHRVCKECGAAINSPCSTIQVIAEALGVKDEELIEKEGPTDA